MIFQFFNLLEDLTVADNVLLPAQLAGVRRSRAGGRAAELLARLGIERYRDRYPGRLLRELNQDGQTLVLVTHSSELAASYAGRTVRLVDGRVVETS
jgi:putative ABC transport system ATP-binding protein